MAGKTETEPGQRSGVQAVSVIGGSFSVIVLLAAIAYSVIVNVVDWVTIDVLTYPVADVAPFVVITGAILTIPIVIPTVFVSLNLLKS